MEFKTREKQVAAAVAHMEQSRSTTSYEETAAGLLTLGVDPRIVKIALARVAPEKHEAAFERLHLREEEAEQARKELEFAMHQLVHGFDPDGIEWDFEVCLRNFRSAVADMNEAMDEAFGPYPSEE